MFIGFQALISKDYIGKMVNTTALKVYSRCNKNITVVKTICISTCQQIYSYIEYEKVSLIRQVRKKGVELIPNGQGLAALLTEGYRQTKNGAIRCLEIEILICQAKCFFCIFCFVNFVDEVMFISEEYLHKFGILVDINATVLQFLNLLF